MFSYKSIKFHLCWWYRWHMWLVSYLKHFYNMWSLQITYIPRKTKNIRWMISSSQILYSIRSINIIRVICYTMVWYLVWWSYNDAKRKNQLGLLYHFVHYIQSSHTSSISISTTITFSTDSASVWLFWLKVLHKIII